MPGKRGFVFPGLAPEQVLISKKVDSPFWVKTFQWQQWKKIQPMKKFLSLVHMEFWFFFALDTKPKQSHIYVILCVERVHQERMWIPVCIFEKKFHPIYINDGMTVCGTVHTGTAVSWYVYIGIILPVGVVFVCDTV